MAKTYTVYIFIVSVTSEMNFKCLLLKIEFHSTIEDEVVYKLHVGIYYNHVRELHRLILWVTFISINVIAFTPKVIDVIKEQRQQEELSITLKKKKKKCFSPLGEYVSCIDG